MHSQQNIKRTKLIFSRQTFLETYDLAMMAISFVFISSFSKKKIVLKQANVKNRKC